MLPLLKAKIGINSNFGLKSELGNDDAAGSIGRTTDLKTINAKVSASYCFNEQLSLRVGINMVYREAELIRHTGNVLESGITTPGVGLVVAPVRVKTEIVNMGATMLAMAGM